MHYNIFANHLSGTSLLKSLCCFALYFCLPASTLRQTTRLPFIPAQNWQDLCRYTWSMMPTLVLQHSMCHCFLTTVVIMCSRAYQQVDLLNSLQSFMLTPRKPCGHMSRALGARQMPPSTSTIDPSAMANMWGLASSRLSSMQAPSDSLDQVCLMSDTTGSQKPSMHLVRF